MGKEKQIERNCNNCKRQHTRYCPNSSECISLPNLPYFETDVIRLLEHDWDMHEKEIDELKAENERIRQTSVTHETFKAIMDEKNINNSKVFDCYGNYFFPTDFSSSEDNTILTGGRKMNDKEKTISEMAEIIKKADCDLCLATALYDAGYRLEATLTSDFIETVQKHAVQDFAEKLKAKMPKLDAGEKGEYFSESDIDKIAKEMMEE